MQKFEHFVAFADGNLLMPFFRMREAISFSGVCRSVRKSVGSYPWSEEGNLPPIQHSCIVISGCEPVTAILVSQIFAFVNHWNYGDWLFLLPQPAASAAMCRLQHTTLCFSSECTFSTWPAAHSQPSQTKPLCTSLFFARWCQGRLHNNGCSHLRDVHTLNMARCFQKTISNGAFRHLVNLHTLDMSRVYQVRCLSFGLGSKVLALYVQDTVTDECFRHLTGLQSLSIAGCSQFTDAAFDSLPLLTALNLNRCNKVHKTHTCTTTSLSGSSCILTRLSPPTGCYHRCMFRQAASSLFATHRSVSAVHRRCLHARQLSLSPCLQRDPSHTAFLSSCLSLFVSLLVSLLSPRLPYLYERSVSPSPSLSQAPVRAREPGHARLCAQQSHHVRRLRLPAAAPQSGPQRYASGGQ